MAVSFDPGRDKGGQQFLLLCRANDLSCRNHSPEPLAPRQPWCVRRLCRLERGTAQRIDAPFLTILVLRYPPKIEQGEQRCPQCQHEDGGVEWTELHLADANGEISLKDINQGLVVQRYKHC